jgi:hypothetical protein
MKIEQRINLKFLVKLKKSPTECFQMLKEVYGDNVMSRTRVLISTNGSWEVGRKWKKTNVRDALQHQKPKKMCEIVCKDRRLSIRMVAEMVNMGKETVRQILHDQLDMMKSHRSLLPFTLWSPLYSCRLY